MPPDCARVLVVDDDADLRDMIADTLRDVGYDVDTAEDGNQALASMRASAPCLVLLDLMMPRKNGWQVVDEMQHDPALAAIPVCIVSAQASSAPAEAADVLRKPVSRDSLLRAVRDYCGSPPAESAGR